MMKVLFIDSSAELQQKWIEPLRTQGWGAVHARSVEEADRVMLFHGDSLAAVVVSEGFVSWTEQNTVPFVVLTKTWTEVQITKHQNSQKPAFGYISFQAAMPELVQLIEARTRQNHSSSNLRATGTDSAQAVESTVALSLENFTDVMSKPEATSTSTNDFSIKLDAPTVFLGGKPADAPSEPIAELKIAPAPVEVEESNENRTMILDPTKIEFDTKSDEVSSPGIDPLEELQAMTHTHQSLPPVAPIMNIPVTQFAVNHAPTSAPSDVETLKSYLGLREQDVAILTGQVRSSQERIQQLEMQLKVERARGGELQHLVQKQEQQIKNYDRDKQIEFEVLYKQVEDLNNQLKERTDKARTIEARLKMTTDEVDKVKERVRVDIRRIRVREKELESQLEILKKDSSALLMARDEKILELKRKLDLLEFNMELVQEQYSKERDATDQLRTRLKHAATAMREAGGLLDHEN
jgi:uncharacterized protein YfcZ (UPF0381/DUF406 family)